MTGPQGQGLIAQGPLPAGMLRIQQGHQERYVWPVHLPGWLALGWRVAGAEATAAKPLLPGVMAPVPAAVLELIPESSASSAGPEPGTGRGKRGRRRREEQEQPPAAVEATPEETGTTAEVGDTDSEPRVTTDLAAESAAESADHSTAEATAALSVLPDDLFNDPLI